MSLGYKARNYEIGSTITYDELRRELEGNKNILSNNVLEYFDELLKLEKSILSASTCAKVSNEDKELLNQLDIYYKIKLFNLCYFTKKVLDDNKIKYEANGNTNTLTMTSFRLDALGYRNIIFDYYFSDNKKKNYFDENCDYVSFHVVKDGEEQRKIEMDRVLEKLEKLYDAKCPYPSYKGFYDGPDSNWYYENKSKIKKYEELFNRLDQKKELTLAEKEEIKVSTQMNELLINAHEIDMCDFVDINDYEINMPRRAGTKNDSCLNKVLVKKTPDALIKQDIRYL